MVATTAPPPAHPTPTPSPVKPITQPRQNQSQSQKGNLQQPGAPTAPTPIRTKPAAYKDRYFLFSQISAQLRAGINAFKAFQDVAGRTSHPGIKESLDHIGRTALSGGNVSETLDLYIDLYPKSVVGMVRAGETGGFLPEACDVIAEQSLEAHKFTRNFKALTFAVFNFILVIPGFMLIRGMLINSWDLNESGQSSGMPAVMAGLIQSLIWPIGPMTLLAYGAFFVGWRLVNSHKYALLRHRIGLTAPILKVRARHENLSTFAWVMANLSKGGLAPNTCWQYAAESVPNLEMQRLLINAGNSWRDGAKMSDMIFQSQLFPEEYAPILATGEYTGDLPGSLAKLADISKSEYDTAQNHAKMRLGGCGCSLLFITGAIAMLILAYVWFREIPSKILDGMDQ